MGDDLKPKLHSGQTVELQITSTNDEGFGVAFHEGTRVLVAGALPGEVLIGRVTYVGRREAFANILRPLKTSPDRETAPACGMGRACDGCGLMQMRYPAQLAWKKNLVTNEFSKHPALFEAKIYDTIASPKQLNYRNTAKLVIAGKHSDPVIGIYRRNTHDVLEIEDCQLHHPLINKVVKAAKQGIKKGKVPIYNAKSEMGLLRYLVVRVAEPSDQVMVVFVTSEQGYNEVHHLAKFVQQAVPEVAVVAQNINSSTGNVIFGHKDRFLTKAQTLRAYVGKKSFNLSPHSFFQVNSGAAHIIYQKVRELAQLSGTERVLDVYCGIGGISLYLADKAKEVVGIEFVEAAVADATQNAALNRAENCSFEAGDAARLIDEIGEEGGADVIVLNPPRKGCDPKVLKSVAAINPERIIYVSCSPETLARDLDILSGLGYRTVEVHPVDMFPQTVHVEDVALVVRNTH
jgi:23S rRNA (uracil1939-C5)-methyltransferase